MSVVILEVKSHLLKYHLIAYWNIYKPWVIIFYVRSKYESCRGVTVIYENLSII